MTKNLLIDYAISNAKEGIKFTILSMIMAIIIGFPIIYILRNLKIDEDIILILSIFISLSVTLTVDIKKFHFLKNMYENHKKTLNNLLENK